MVLEPTGVLEEWGIPSPGFSWLPLSTLILVVVILVMATVLGVELPIHRHNVLATLGVAALLVVMWGSGFAAGTYRSNASREWQADLQKAWNQFASGAIDVALTFSLNWPFADAVFPGVTSQRVPCDWLIKTEG